MNQIDHLMINGMWRRSLLDFKVKRSADVGSDHHLVTALVKIKLKKTEANYKTQKKFDIQRLRDNTIKAAFITELSTGEPIKDKHGTVLNTENEQEERLTEHFHKVLKRPSPDETAVIPEST